MSDTPNTDNSNIQNQYDSFTTNSHLDFKFNSPSYKKVTSDLQHRSNNLKVYHQNLCGLRGKLNQLSNILYSELPHIICIGENHLKDLEMDMISIEHYKLGTKFCRQQYKMMVCVYLYIYP